MDNFFTEETWAGYKSLDIGGKKFGFVYGWEDVDQEYLKRVVEKYPESFILEKNGETSFLKIKDASRLTIDVLLDIADNDPTGWVEIIDLGNGKLLNSSKNGDKSVAFESLQLKELK